MTCVHYGILMLLGKSIAIALNLTADSSPHSRPPYARGSAFPPVREILVSTLQDACLSRLIRVLVPSLPTSRLDCMRMRTAQKGPSQNLQPHCSLSATVAAGKLPPPFARQCRVEERLEGVCRKSPLMMYLAFQDCVAEPQCAIP